MKKTIIILLAVMVMISSVSLAEDLSSLPDADLLVLYRQVSIELESRGIDPKAVYPEDAFSGDDLWTEEMAERLELFFGFWSESDIPNMLTVCSPGWKADKENPDIDLLAILANRTPTDYEILSVSTAAEDSRIISLIAGIDRNNGMDPAKYYLQISITREADGIWYVDPGSLENYEYTAGGSYADPVPGAGEETPETAENKYRAVSFRDAVEAAGEFISVGGDVDYLAAAAEKDGKFIRMVTLLDDHAKELYMAAMGAGDSGEAFEAFNTYAWALPVTYTEELAAKPKEQAELDMLAGKTVGELLADGYSFYGIGGGENLPTTVALSYGLFNYEFEVDASFEKYRENEGWDGLEDMKVKSGVLSGFSGSATNPDWLADGTYEPRFVPHITAEEAAAAEQIPPAEEYTAKAWPLNDEGYSDLLDNTEARYGQVYMAEGVVHQVLSLSPLKMVVNTSADGKSRPVMIEYPGQPGFSPEAGSRCRIYADVTSSCYILPVLTARYIFSGLASSPADEPAPADEDTFTVPNIIPAKGIGDFFGEWYYYMLVNEDGSEMDRKEMLAEGFVDDHAEIIISEDEIKLYTASLGDAGSVKYEFVPDDGSLRILNGSDELPVLRLADNGMLLLFIPSYNLPSGNTMSYLTREKP